MLLPRTAGLGLALAGLCALGAARPAAAQDLLYALSGVSFADGAVATGSFSFNPTTSAFGAYNLTTTAGVTGGLLGANYTPGKFLPSFVGAPATSESLFTFTLDKGRFLVLATTVPALTPGLYPLLPGQFVTVPSPQILNSGEFITQNGAQNGRGIVAGSLAVTAAAPVPETSTTASLGLLLALGLSGLAVAAKRKKTTAHRE